MKNGLIASISGRVIAFIPCVMIRKASWRRGARGDLARLPVRVKRFMPAFLW
jgi:hypothetical protein